MFINLNNKRFIIIFAVVAIILLIPFLAMQFTDEVNWNLFDFVIAAILLLSAGFAFDLIIRKVKGKKYRCALSISLLVLLLLAWAELAVGIFGTPLGGN